MRHTFKQIPKFRIRTGFLFFPKTIGHQLRWFETAKWKEEFRVSLGDTWWEPIEWID
jgi:hypothetical protein